MRRIGTAVPVFVATLALGAGCSDETRSGADKVAPPTGSAATSASVPTTQVGTTMAVPVTTQSAVTQPAVTTTDPTVPATEAPSTYDFSAVGAVMADFVVERGLDGAGLVVVERDAGIVHEEYLGGFAPDRISLVASSSKMITAGVLMYLHDHGLLDVDRPVADAAGWGAGNPAITPAQLVSNSSGLVGLLPDPGYGPYLCQWMPSADLQQCAAEIFSTSADDADVVPPDTEFRYGGAQWQVAGAVAEAASGRSWAELIDEIYVGPCGLETLAFNNHWAASTGFEYPPWFDGDPSTLEPTDNPNLEGGAYLTPTDYAQLLLMHLRGGRCGDVQVLSQESLDRMHTDRTVATYGGGTSYGLGWWIDERTGLITDSGAYGAVAWLDLADGYGAFLVLEDDAGTGAELAAQLYEPVEAAVAAAT